MNFKPLLTCVLATAALCAQAEAPYTYAVGDEIELNNLKYVVVSENLVPNGDFAVTGEEGLKDWTCGTATDGVPDKMGPANFTIEQGGPEGFNRLVCTAKASDAGSNSAYAIKQFVPLVEGKTYLISFHFIQGPGCYTRLYKGTSQADCVDANRLYHNEKIERTEWEHVKVAYTATDLPGVILNCGWIADRGASYACVYVVEIEASDFSNALAAAQKYTPEAYPLASTDKFTALQQACQATPSNENAAAIVKAYREIVESNSLAEAVENRTDATSFILNPKAENGLDNWTLAQADGGASLSVKTDEMPVYSDGTTLPYFDGGNWGASDWTTRFEQKTSGLPAGRYRIAVTARGSVDLRWLRLSVTDAANPDKTASVDIAHTGANAPDGDFGRGYSDHVLDFETTGDITISLQANTQKIHNWHSFTNFRLTRIGNAGLQTEALERAITDADQILTHTTAGEGEGLFSQELRDILEEAFKKAKDLLEEAMNASYSDELQNEINEATTALNDAVKAYGDSQVFVVANKWYYIRNTVAKSYWQAMTVTESDGYTQNVRIVLSAENPTQPSDGKSFNDHKFKFVPVEGSKGRYYIYNAANFNDNEALLALNTNDDWITYAFPYMEKATPFGVVAYKSDLLITTYGTGKNGSYMAPDPDEVTNQYKPGSDIYSNKDRSYAQKHGTVEVIRVSDADIPAGIENVATDASNNDNTVYDLYGRRVANPTPGIYIVNGKKTVIR